MSGHPELRQAARRITQTLFLSQSLTSAGLIATHTVAPILGVELSGLTSLAGLPATLHLVGAALSALVWGILMDRLGRRPGLGAGLGIAVFGGAVAALSIGAGSFLGFLLGMVLTGIGRAAMDLGRFFSAEVHPSAERGQAISRVVLGGTVGAVFGPLLVGPSGAVALRLGTVELLGPFAAAVALFAVAAILVFARLRPEPRDLARRVAETETHGSGVGEARPLLAIIGQPGAWVAITTMVIGQVVMVMLMVITSLHMHDHQHPISSISLVIAAHTLGMFAFSLLTGWLTDRLGRLPVIAGGAGLLAISSLMARLSPEVLPLAAALFLLGLGWNFCYVGGSTLLSDHLLPSERSRTQGFNDLLIGLVSASGSLGSGLVYAGAGYESMGLLAAAASIVPLALALGLGLHRRRAFEAV